jgi:peptide/nickel transport system permease protein
MSEQRPTELARSENLTPGEDSPAATKGAADGLWDWMRRKLRSRFLDARERKKVITEEEFQFLTVRQLMWRKFIHNRMAVLSLVVLIFLYLITVFADFVSPAHFRSAYTEYSWAPPQPLRFHDPETGQWSLRPFVYPIRGERNLLTFRRDYTEDRSTHDTIHFFVHGDPYKLLGIFETDVHLFGTESGKLFLMGADQRGRDVLSRIIYGGRVSLTIGFLGVTISVVLGSVIGAISGYRGGTFDMVTQRVIELLRAFPTLPLWMALAAAIPVTWSPEAVYAGIVIVLAFLGWTGLAREIRGKVLSLKEQDFVLYAESSGASGFRIVRKHMIPNLASHILVTATLAIPITILGESALSFLGLGVRPPMVSWGLLLSEALKIQIISLYPWTLFPSIFIWTAVMTFNFLGDGLRDMVDPFSR